MNYFVCWTIHQEWREKIEEALKGLGEEGFLLEILPIPKESVAVFPESLPSACIVEKEQKENPWIRLLRQQFPEAAFFTFDGKKLAAWTCRERSFPEWNGVSLLKTREFLEAMLRRERELSFSDFSLPDFSRYSFVCLIADVLESGEETFRKLFERYPRSFGLIMDEGERILFVLYDLTGNYAALERERKRLIGKERFRAGILHHGLAGMVSSFLEALQVLYTNRLVSECHCFDEISSPTGSILKSQKLMEVERSIRTDLQFREGRNVMRYLRQWFQECENFGHTLEDMKYDSINLYASIKYTLFDMYELKLKRIKAGREVHEILNIQSKGELEQWFYTWFLYTLDNFDLAHSGARFQIQKVLQFIDNHILDDLSLSSVASYFYVNPSYFSTLFRQETGQTYISYVTGVKMKKALELLKEDFKVYETAHMLGYEDVHHFRNVFKKYHGIPPSQVKSKE